MKKIILIAGILMVAQTSSFAQQVTPPDPNRQTMFNNVTDFFATVGQSGQAKKDTIADRKEERRLTRTNAWERKKKAQMRKQMQQQQKEILQKTGSGTSIGL